VLKTLVDIGFSQADAQVYLFLSRKGPQKGRAISRALNMNKQQLYPCLKNLQSKGIVNATIEYPAKFSAVPFEKVLDLFIRAKMEEAQRIQQSKERILSDWQSIAIGEKEEPSAKFMVLKGRSTIYSKIQQMIMESKSQISTITTVPGLMQADQLGLFDTGFSYPLKSKVQFRFLAELSQKNVNVMKALLKEAAKAKLNLKGRSPDLGLRLFPRMVIRDEGEALFFITSRTETSIIEQDDVCLWTDCKSLVDAFSAVFEDLWHNSTDIQKKIYEIETGKPTPKTCVIDDAEAAEKKYDEALESAEKEIIMITSSQGLVEHWKNKPLLEKWQKSGASVKIMAPIVRENYEAAQQLSKFCAVRHAPTNYLGTTIIDGKHLFQFKTRSPDQEKLESTPHFENTFYTNDLEYIEKTKTTLNDIWKNTRAPSIDTLETMFGPGGQRLVFPDDSTERGALTFINDDPLGALTEKDVLDKILHAQKIPYSPKGKIISRAYYSGAIAIIHPPKHFSLPDLLIHAYHYEKPSTFGAGDVLIIHMRLETPKGQKYVPVTVAIGGNTRDQWIWEKRYESSPAGQNVRLLSKDDLQIRIHGNNFFAGWTVPIPLFPPQRILPPACLLIEAYGDVKTAAYTVRVPFEGIQFKFEENYFNAFVTFMHPSSKYSGPGTDGFFLRDVVFTWSPLTKNGKPGNTT
jgi:sugar-specific transcriptional regulator TrmB